MAYLIDANIAIHARDGTDAVPVLPFDAAAAEAYGGIIAQCRWVRGHDYDRMIAAHAISTASILVTDNDADFRDIPGLTRQNRTLRR